MHLEIVLLALRMCQRLLSEVFESVRCAPFLSHTVFCEGIKRKMPPKLRVGTLGQRGDVKVSERMPLSK